MFAETVDEKGCFSGCLPFLIIGLIVGVTCGMLFFDGICAQYGMTGPMGKMAGGCLGAIAGLFVGGIVGFVFGRIFTAIKKKEDDF